MSIDRVVLSSNNNPDYIEFWPLVAQAWQKMGIRPTLALIGTSDVVVDETLGDVIRFDPIAEVPESMHAQAIRLLLPALFPEDVCIISDIDMLPLDSHYFYASIEEFSEESFIVYRDQGYQSGVERYPMCYNAAKGSTFAEIFKVTKREDIPDIIQNWCELGFGWNTDEIILTQSLKEWNHESHLLQLLGHVVERRLDRSNWRLELILIKDFYIDCHMPRPYSQYREEIDFVFHSYFPF